VGEGLSRQDLIYLLLYWDKGYRPEIDLLSKIVVSLYACAYEYNNQIETMRQWCDKTAITHTSAKNICGLGNPAVRVDLNMRANMGWAKTFCMPGAVSVIGQMSWRALVAKDYRCYQFQWWTLLSKKQFK